MGLLDSIRTQKLIGFRAEAGELVFSIYAAEDFRDEARASAMRHRESLESYVVSHSAFKTSFVPLPVAEDAPEVVRAMGEAAETAHVAPMVCMPGALCEAIARDLSIRSREVIVSCEGDTFIVGNRTRTFPIDVPALDGTTLGLRVRSLGSQAIFASVGRKHIDPYIGHARAVAVVAGSGALASATASGMGYAMHRPYDVDRALDVAKRIDGVSGAVLIAEGGIGMWGDIELVSITGSEP